jgi:two-component system, NarL family, nitrate/nitrite response regulator NarL
MNETMSSRRSPEFQRVVPRNGHGRTNESVASEQAPRQDCQVLAAPLHVEAARRDGGTRILIADDLPIFRDGLRKLIESQRGFCVIGESAIGAEVIRLARELRPDILLLDLGLPQRSAFRVLNDLAGLAPPVRTLVMVSAVEEGPILEAFYLGAHGIVLKGSSREVLLKSIRSVIAGQYWLDHESVPIVIEAVRKSFPSWKGATGEKDYGLTPRELKIVERIATGSSNKEMGQEFSISERTVKHHLTNVFNKLGMSSRLELAVFALEHGLVNRG